MKKILLAAALLLSATSGAMAQNIDIHIGDSGYYGRIDLGNLGRPPVIYQQPMIIERVVGYQRLEPTYLRVPPGHAKKWSKHCSRYNACGRPVYFVQDSWYSNTYAPRYRETQRNYRDERGHGRDKDYYKDRREQYKEEQKDRREFLKEREKDRREFAREREKDRREYRKERREDRGDDHGGRGHGNGKH